jgi:Fic family protein
MDKKNFREYFGRDAETGQNFVYKEDVDTGDLISKTPVIEKRDTSDYFGKGAFYTMSRSFDMFVEEKYHEYSKLEFGILGWLRKNIMEDNYIRYFRQQELAETFKTDQANVSKSLKKLSNDEIIAKDKKRGQYVFSPKYVRYIFGDGGMENAENIFENS